MNVRNDVTATLFSVFFYSWYLAEKDTENDAAVTSLRTFLPSTVAAFFKILKKPVQK
jgi:hypothetical protein